MTIRDWERQRHHPRRRQGVLRHRRPRLLLVPAGVQGPGFLMLQNFRVIMRYNPAEAYALAIGHLADRLRGAEPSRRNWPRYERVLTRSERLELQELLARRGYDVGEPDGRLGAGRARRSAISRRRSVGFPTASPRPGSSTSCAGGKG